MATVGAVALRQGLQEQKGNFTDSEEDPFAFQETPQHPPTANSPHPGTEALSIPLLEGRTKPKKYPKWGAVALSAIGFVGSVAVRAVAKTRPLKLLSGVGIGLSAISAAWTTSRPTREKVKAVALRVFSQTPFFLWTGMYGFFNTDPGWLQTTLVHSAFIGLGVAGGAMLRWAWQKGTFKTDSSASGAGQTFEDIEKVHPWVARGAKVVGGAASIYLARRTDGIVRELLSCLGSLYLGQVAGEVTSLGIDKRIQTIENKNCSGEGGETSWRKVKTAANALTTLARVLAFLPYRSAPASENPQRLQEIIAASGIYSFAEGYLTQSEKNRMENVPIENQREWNEIRFKKTVLLTKGCSWARVVDLWEKFMGLRKIEEPNCKRRFLARLFFTFEGLSALSVLGFGISQVVTQAESIDKVAAALFTGFFYLSYGFGKYADDGVKRPWSLYATRVSPRILGLPLMPFYLIPINIFATNSKALQSAKNLQKVMSLVSWGSLGALSGLEFNKLMSQKAGSFFLNFPYVFAIQVANQSYFSWHGQHHVP